MSPDTWDLSCSAAARVIAEVSGGGRPVAPSTVHRWLTQGVRIGNRRIVLASVMVGGRRRRTSQAAIAEWIASCTAAAAGEEPPAQPQPSSSGVLDRAGIR